MPNVCVHSSHFLLKHHHAPPWSGYSLCLLNRKGFMNRTPAFFPLSISLLLSNVVSSPPSYYHLVSQLKGDFLFHILKNEIQIESINVRHPAEFTQKNEIKYNEKVFFFSNFSSLLSMLHTAKGRQISHRALSIYH